MSDTNLFFAAHTCHSACHSSFMGRALCVQVWMYGNTLLYVSSHAGTFSWPSRPTMASQVPSYFKYFWQHIFFWTKQDYIEKEIPITFESLPALNIYHCSSTVSVLNIMGRGWREIQVIPLTPYTLAVVFPRVPEQTEDMCFLSSLAWIHIILCSLISHVLSFFSHSGSIWAEWNVDGCKFSPLWAGCSEAVGGVASVLPGWSQDPSHWVPGASNACCRGGGSGWVVAVVSFAVPPSSSLLFLLVNNSNTLLTVYFIWCFSVHTFSPYFERFCSEKKKPQCKTKQVNLFPKFGHTQDTLSFHDSDNDFRGNCWKYILFLASWYMMLS